jgi:hypothetical protein
MEKKNKILLVVIFLFVIIAFIYSYSCNSFILGGNSGSGGSNPNIINPNYQCYLDMKNGKVCPDCTTPIVKGFIGSCPTSIGTKMCNNGNLND